MRAGWLVSILSFTLFLGSFFAAQTFAVEGDGNGSSTAPATCSAPNAYEGLCGSPAGSKGGGASWHLYSVTAGHNNSVRQDLRGGSGLLSGYNVTTSDIKRACADEGWYIAYGWDDTNYGNGSSILWGPARWKDLSATYNSYGAKSFSYIQKNGFSNNIKLTKDAALTLYKRLHGSARNIPEDTGYFCMSPSALYNFDTEVSIDMGSAEVVYAGEKTSFNAYITVGKREEKYSGTSTPDNTEIQIVEFTTDQNLTDLSQSSSNDSPKTYFQNKYGNALEFQSKTGALSQGRSNNYGSSRTVPEKTVGNKYCIAIGVKPARSGTEGSLENVWNFSTTCRTIAKKPSVQIENSSAYSNGSIMTSSSTKQTTKRTYGSWAEYFAIAGKGNISNFSSGGALAYGSKSSDICELSSLTIANTKCNNGNLLGNSNIESTNFTERFINYFAEDATILNPNQNIDNNSFSEKDIIYIKGDANINTNIIFETGQKIIMADGNININTAVAQIDAWLISKGTINTCVNYNIGDMNSDECNQQLAINGIVSAKNIILNRTAGAEIDDYSKSGENIIFSPAAYLWSHNQASTHFGSSDTIYLRELAPRY